MTFRTDLRGPHNPSTRLAAKAPDRTLDEVIDDLKKIARGIGRDAEKARVMLAALKGK